MQTPSDATLVPAPEESVNFETTRNLFVEGDNLEVLKLLHKAYFGRVKLIYIDPPYNTGNDFIYPDDYSQPLDRYLELTGQADDSGNRLTTNAETSGRYHSAWLSMMYPRLALARQMLREDGAIFVSIDDTEAHDLRMLLDEVFGEENFVANLIWEKKYSPQNDARWFSDTHDHILVYCRDRDHWQPNRLPRTAEADARYSNPDGDARGPWKASDFSVKTYSAKYDYPITTPSGRVVNPPKGRCWAVGPEQFARLAADGRIWFGPDGANVPALKRFLAEVQDGMVAKTIWFRGEVGDNQEARRELKALGIPFDTPKPTRLLKRILQLATNPHTGDLVLDFFAGSGTTAAAVHALNAADGGNRRFLAVQLPEPTGDALYPTIADIAKARIRGVIAALDSADDGKLSSLTRERSADRGFRVFRLGGSHLRQWHIATPSDAPGYVQALTDFAYPPVREAETLNAIWEVALREGYSLTSHIARVPAVTDQTVYRVSDPEKDQSLAICLDATLRLDALRPLVRSTLPISSCVATPRWMTPPPLTLPCDAG